MLQLIWLGTLALLTAPALAEDIAVTTLPSASSGDSVIQLIEPAPTTEVPVAPDIIQIAAPAEAKVDCPPPAPTPESEADKLRKLQSALALKKIELFRRTVKDTARSKSAFSLFSSSATPVDSDLLVEMDNFTEHFGDLPETAEVFHLKALVHQRMEAYPAAAVDSLLLLVAYPDSPFAAEAEKRLKELGGDQLKKQSAVLKSMLQKTRSLSGDRDHRIAAFLSNVGNALNESNFAAPLAAECAAFLMSNQTYLNEDVIEHALARQAMLVDHQIAIYHFDKLLALYPDSPHRPDSLLSIATIQRKGQHSYEQAVKTFNRLIEQYPESEESKQGYESLAAMYDEDMRDYPDAIKTYDAIVAKYKNDPIVLRALRNMALIQQNRLNQPAKAIDSYLRIAAIFSGVDGLDALNKAAKIAMYTTRDWKAAIDINNRIIAFVPGGEDAVKALYANAELTENKLNDKVEAKALYEKVIADFPNHPLAKEAKKRIAAMEKK